MDGVRIRYVSHDTQTDLKVERLICEQKECEELWYKFEQPKAMVDPSLLLLEDLLDERQETIRTRQSPQLSISCPAFITLPMNICGPDTIASFREQCLYLTSPTDQTDFISTFAKIPVGECSCDVETLTRQCVERACAMQVC
jgi:hypothetical protein